MQGFALASNYENSFYGVCEISNDILNSTRPCMTLSNGSVKYFDVTLNTQGQYILNVQSQNITYVQSLPTNFIEL